MLRVSFLLALLALPISAFGQGAPTDRIAILTDLVNAIGAAGKAISDITAGVKDLVVAGKDAYSYVAAERERNRLNDIVRRTTNLIASQNARVVRSLDEYLAQHNPTAYDWNEVVANINSTLTSVQELLADVEKENGSFVNQNAALALKKTLAARSVLLERLAAVAPPFSKEERVLLKKASGEYKILIANAEAAVNELNTYITAKK